MIVDWELPFRDGADGALAGRFQNLADWAGIPTSRYYSLCFSRRDECRSVAADLDLSRGVLPDMAYRLMVLGGAAARSRPTTRMSCNIRERTDVNGRQFCEVVNRWQFANAGRSQGRGVATRRRTSRPSG